MSLFDTHSRCIRFITLVIPLFLISAGMRVPDFTQPQKPKPVRRAVLEKTSSRTIADSFVKVAVGPVITSHHALVFHAADDFSPEAHPVYLPVPLLSLSPLAPRAPPASSSFA